MDVALHRLHLRILLSVLCHELILTILIFNSYLKRFQVDIEGEGLLRKQLHCIEDQTAGNGKRSFAVAFAQADQRSHAVLAIAGRDVKLSLADIKHEAFQDGHGVFGVDDLRQCLQSSAQRGA